jgi:hypothetical protein
MDLTILKLVNGEIVLGELQLETDETIILGKPMSLMLDPMQGGVGMIPFDAIYTQKELEEITFDKTHVMYEMEVHPTFEEAYIKQTTGIETPATPEIIA